MSSSPRQMPPQPGCPTTRITEWAALGELNTFGVEACARWLARLEDPQELPALLGLPDFADTPSLVLGGGSNTLFTGDYPGLVVLMANRGIQVESGDGDSDRIRVAAGENWDRFVRWSLEQGYCGLENLILIPGSVGAAPIQNIGAYGVEVASFIESVRVWDRDASDFRVLAANECRFAYRDSLFKQQRNRFLVTELTLRLPRQGEPQLDYAGVREALAERGIESPSATEVAGAVESLRLAKLPNPAEIGNAGSFFKNPVVSRPEAARLAARHPELPVFPLQDGNCKLSAAWLIEACGLKGQREGAAGVSERHALVLVNHGGASGADIWRLAEQIRAQVEDHFAVRLEAEPVVV
jgi:UDP-N-acetylmuramate dehydrogenase